MKRLLSIFLTLFYVLILVPTVNASSIRTVWAQELPDDFATLVHDSYRSMQKEYEDLGIVYDTFLDAFVDEIKEGLHDPNNFICLAYDGDAAVGVAYFQMQTPTKVHLECLAVKRDNHKRGIGTILFNSIVEKYPPPLEVTLHTRKFNTVSQLFYKKMGCKIEEGDRPGYLSLTKHFLPAEDE